MVLEASSPVEGPLKGPIERPIQDSTRGLGELDFGRIRELWPKMCAP